MGADCFARFPGQYRFLLLIFALLVESAVAQVPSGGIDSGGMSLGSTWTRHSDSSSATRFRGSGVGFRQVSRPPVRFFGGVTVGRGFHPFYYPGYFGTSPWIFPGSIAAPCYSWGTPGFYFSFRSSPAGVWYPGFDPILSPYYFGGGSGDTAAPSISSLPSTAYRTPVSRSRINPAPKVEFGPSFAPQFTAGQYEQVDWSTIKGRAETAISQAPLTGEFAAAAAEDRPVTTVDRIESQRLQTEGDRALRAGDAELARTFYQAAVRAAPNRQSPWIRMAWVHIFQRDFPKAAAELNRALLIQEEQSAWVQADYLLHDSAVSGPWLSDASLHRWLLERPGSADRLLLAAAFQYFLGDEQMGSQLLALSRSAGVDQSSSAALGRIATSQDRRFPVESATALADRVRVQSDLTGEPAAGLVDSQSDLSSTPAVGSR